MNDEKRGSGDLGQRGIYGFLIIAVILLLAAVLYLSQAFNQELGAVKSDGGVKYESDALPDRTPGE